MNTFADCGLQQFCNQLTLTIRHTYHGTNPGCWESCCPNNRLICILDSDGESSFTDCHGTIPLTAGTTVLIPAFHHISHRQNDSMIHLSIHFTLNLFAGIDLLAQENQCWINHQTQRLQYLENLDQISDALVLTVTFRHLVLDVLLTMLREGNLKLHDQSDTCSAYAPLFHFLTENCHAGITVQQMAQTMRMTRESFIKKFIYDTGMAPKRFFLRMLAARASQMLISTHQTIRETAHQLNFCNPFYFSRFFHRQLGCSPRDYRRRYQHHDSQSTKITQP